MGVIAFSALSAASAVNTDERMGTAENAEAAEGE